MRSAVVALLASLSLTMTWCGPVVAQEMPPPAVAPFDAAQAKQYQERWARHLARQVAQVNSIGMKMVLVPPGQFTMGSPLGEQGRADHERPCRVTLSKAFYLSATEVTQKQWMTFTDKNPSFATGDCLPVDTVTWEQAAEFCRKLGAKEGARYRLPTEAEWEYACRAGTTTPFSTGATISTDQANYDGNYTYGAGRKGVFRETSTDAGSFAPNAWGLHDMHGNLWEWCADWYGDYPQGETRDPVGPAQGDTRVVRGGCWINFPAVCRSANRGSIPPVSWNFHMGFRVARDVD